jgi:hypothetical protein
VGLKWIFKGVLPLIEGIDFWLEFLEFLTLIWLLGQTLNHWN